MFHIVNSLLSGKVSADTALAEIDDQIDWSDVHETLRRTLCLPAKEVGLNDWEKLAQVFVAAVPQESHQCFTEFLVTHAYNKHIRVRIAIASVIVALVDKFPPHEIRCSIATMDEFLHAIMALMQDRSPDVRLRGLKVCKHWELQQLHKWVRTLTSDLVPTVRANAVRRLRWPADQDIVCNRLRDKCVTVRRAAMSRIETVPEDIVKRDLALATADDPRLDDACRNMLRGWVEREPDGLWKLVEHPSQLLLRHLGSVDSVAMKLAMASPTDGTPIGRAFLIRALAYCGKEPNISAAHILAFLPPPAPPSPRTLATLNNSAFEDNSARMQGDTACSEHSVRIQGDTACGDDAVVTIDGNGGGAPGVDELDIARNDGGEQRVVRDGEQLISMNIHEDEKLRIGPRVVKDLLFAAVRNNAHQEGMEEVALHVIEWVGLDAAVQDVWAGEPSVFVAAVQLLRRRQKLPVTLPGGPRFPQCVPPTKANALEITIVHDVMRHLTSPTRRLLALHALLSETRTPLLDAESLHHTLTELISHADDTVHSLAVLTSGLVCVLAPTIIKPSFFDTALRCGNSTENDKCSGRPAPVEQRDVDIALQVLAEATQERQQLSLERWWAIVLGGESDVGGAGSRRSLEALNRLLFLCLRIKVPNIFYGKMLTTAFQTVPTKQDDDGKVCNAKNGKKRKMEKQEAEQLFGTAEFRFTIMRFFGMLIQLPSRCAVPLTSLEYCRPRLSILAFIHRLYASPHCLHSKIDSAVTLAYVCGHFKTAECAKALDLIVGCMDAQELFAWVPPAERVTVFQHVANMKHVRPRLAANAAAREASGVEADRIAAVQNARPRRKKHILEHIRAANAAACDGANAAACDVQGTIDTVAAESGSVKKTDATKALESVTERPGSRVVDVKGDRVRADYGNPINGETMPQWREPPSTSSIDAVKKTTSVSDSPSSQVSTARGMCGDENSPSNTRGRNTVTKELGIVVGKESRAGSSYNDSMDIDIVVGKESHAESPYNDSMDMDIDEEFPFPLGQQMHSTHSEDSDEPMHEVPRALDHVTQCRTMHDPATPGGEGETTGWYAVGATEDDGDGTNVARVSSLLHRTEDSRTVDHPSTRLEPPRSTIHGAEPNGQRHTVSQRVAHRPNTRQRKKIKREPVAIALQDHKDSVVRHAPLVNAESPRLHKRSSPASPVKDEERACQSSTRKIARQEGGAELALKKESSGRVVHSPNNEPLAPTQVLRETPPVPKWEHKVHIPVQSSPPDAQGRYAAFNIYWNDAVYSVAATAVLRAGRNRGCDICFQNHRQVSSTHLWLRAVENGAKMEVEDTSAGGTIIQPLGDKSYKIHHAKTTLNPTQTTRLILSGTSSAPAMIMVRKRLSGGSSLVHCASGLLHRLAARSAASTVGSSASSTVCIVDDRVRGTHLRICDYLLKSFAAGVKLHRGDETLRLEEEAEVDLQQNDVLEIAPDLRFQFKVDEQYR
eukprot:GEMP01002167.1.p1 GENE.GEMP01002167.1~~GEMP01002167.1.p1  ORF type:complete len:1470 (+),score=382.07 GEMP01002167.1:139-4548(+)